MKRNEVGKRITAAREALGWTRYEAAKRMGVSRTAWNAWERSLHIPNVISLSRIAVILDTTQAALLGEGGGR